MQSLKLSQCNISENMWISCRYFNAFEVLFAISGWSCILSSCVFGQPFVKRFALCYQTVVCPVCPVLSVTLVHCGQTVGRIEMKLGTQVGLGPGHIVLDGDPAPTPPKGHSHPIFGHICCGQMAAWIKMSLGMELGLDPGDFVLDGDPAPLSQRGTDPNFRPISVAAKWLHGSRCHLARS